MSPASFNASILEYCPGRGGWRGAARDSIQIENPLLKIKSAEVPPSLTREAHRTIGRFGVSAAESTATDGWPISGELFGPDMEVHNAALEARRFPPLQE